LSTALDRCKVKGLLTYLLVYAASADGRYVSRLNGAKLLGPKGVSAESDDHGRVAVVDNKACNVVLYTADGRLASRIGTRGTGIRRVNHLSGPQYCALIPAQLSAQQSPAVVVTDFHNHTVKVAGCVVQS